MRVIGLAAVLAFVAAAVAQPERANDCGRWQEGKSETKN
jgi:hypothetical protein